MRCYPRVLGIKHLRAPRFNTKFAHGEIICDRRATSREICAEESAESRNNRLKMESNVISTAHRSSFVTQQENRNVLLRTEIDVRGRRYEGCG